MTYLAVQNYDNILFGDPESENSAQFLDSNIEMAKVKLTTGLSLGVGLVLISFSIFHVGALTKYLSDSIINAFTVGSGKINVIPSFHRYSLDTISSIKFLNQLF